MKQLLLISLIIFFGMFAHSQTPFECNGDFYVCMKIDGNEQLNRVNIISPTSATFSSIGIPQPEYNAMGYNFVDNYIYATNPAHEVLRISNNGSTENLGVPSNLPLLERVYGGDVDALGNMVLLGRDIPHTLYFIDLASFPLSVQRTVELTEYVDITDIAVHPYTGFLYGFDKDNDKRVVRINPTTGELNYIGANQALNIDGTGAVWFDSNGNLYGYGRRDGDNSYNALFSFDIDTGDATFMVDGPDASSSDGCACAYSLDLLLETDKTNYQTGEIIEYTVTISNGTTQVLNNVDFHVNLPDGLKLTNIPPSIFGGSVTSVQGSTFVEIIDMTVNPGQTSFTFGVLVPCVTSQKTFNSQAQLRNVPLSIATVYSDDPSTTLIDDSTNYNIDIGDYILYPRIESSNGNFVCENSNTTLSIDILADSYLWSGPNFSTSNNYRLILSPLELAHSGTYSVAITKDECEANATFDLTVEPGITVNLGDDIEICDYEDIILDAGSGYDTYNWGVLGHNQTAHPTESGIYTVEVTQGTCPASDEILVTLNNRPLLNITSIDSVCEYETAVNISNYVSSTGTVSYSCLEGNFIDENSGLFSVTNSGVGEFNLNVTAINLTTNCVALPVSQKISVIAKPNVDIKPIESICFNGPMFELDSSFAVVQPEGGEYLWFIDGEEVTQINSHTLQIGPHNIGLLYSNFCTADLHSEVFDIRPSNLPIFDFDYHAVDKVYFPDEDVYRESDSLYVKKQIEFNIETNDNFEFVDFYWDFEDGYGNKNIQSPQYAYNTKGIYTVSLKVHDTIYECENIISKPIQILSNPNCKLVFPNAFLPEENVDNTFYPVFKEGISTDGYKLCIYNRWGHLMWETNDLYAEWNGMYKGSRVSQDVYVYHCKATCEDKEVSVKGDVTVIK